MKKEVLFAIFLGLSLGLIVTFGIYTARTAFLKHTDDRVVSPTATPSATPNDSSLSLFSPDDESVQFDSGVKVNGTTYPSAHVIVFINNASHITSADGTGNFSIETTLDSGSNVITVRALDDNGNQAEQKRTVIFTTPDLGVTASATPSASPTSKTSTSSTKAK